MLVLFLSVCFVCFCLLGFWSGVFLCVGFCFVWVFGGFAEIIFFWGGESLLGFFGGGGALGLFEGFLGGCTLIPLK